jgi:hypothetical protein
MRRSLLVVVLLVVLNNCFGFWGFGEKLTDEQKNLVERFQKSKVNNVYFEGDMKSPEVKKVLLIHPPERIFPTESFEVTFREEKINSLKYNNLHKKDPVIFTKAMIKKISIKTDSLKTKGLESFNKEWNKLNKNIEDEYNINELNKIKDSKWPNSLTSYQSNIILLGDNEVRKVETYCMDKAFPDGIYFSWVNTKFPENINKYFKKYSKESIEKEFLKLATETRLKDISGWETDLMLKKSDDYNIEIFKATGYPEKFVIRKELNKKTWWVEYKNEDDLPIEIKTKYKSLRDENKNKLLSKIDYISKKIEKNKSLSEFSGTAATPNISSLKTNIGDYEQSYEGRIWDLSFKVKTEYGKYKKIRVEIDNCSLYWNKYQRIELPKEFENFANKMIEESKKFLSKKIK